MPIPELLNQHSDAIALAEFANTGKYEFGELTIEVTADKIIPALERAKHQLHFERLSSVTGVDRYPAEPRFEVVYHLVSVSTLRKLRLKVRLPGENPMLESATQVYRSANWYERETFDLFGVIFLHHPNLTRIMMPEDWVDYPLRKDYPVTGTRY